MVTRKPRKVLTERQYVELCALVSKAKGDAWSNGVRSSSPDVYSADERKAAAEADHAAFEAVVQYLANLTKWGT